MAKYMYLYRGPQMDPSQVTKEEMDGIMAHWGRWMDKIGKSLVDMGTPMVNGLSVVDNGGENGAADIAGYSVVEAESMEEAKELLDGHPHLSQDQGVYSVDIFELRPVEM